MLLHLFDTELLKILAFLLSALPQYSNCGKEKEEWPLCINIYDVNGIDDLDLKTKTKTQETCTETGFSANNIYR